MYRALYRKYRPSSFADVVGQDHVVRTLKSQLKSGKISHAYLFTGSRGTGKTSCAKILAKAVNCLNLKDGDACLECESCLRIGNEENFDVVEIDAASNRGIDNIRNLKEQVSYAPAQSKYRVYIIDEVHMLSIEAFNALLKTLEEPPETVIFILATTEVHKLPATILSRCQRFDFRRIDPDIITDRLMKIAQAEELILENDAARLIANMADGGMRDALSLLDMCAARGETITEQTVVSASAMASDEYLFDMSDKILHRDTAGAVELIDKIYKSSVDIQHLCEQLIGYYRDLMIIKSVASAESLIACPKKKLEKLKLTAEKYAIEDVMAIIRELSDALDRMNTANRRSELEMAVIKICTPSLSSTNESIIRRIAALEKGIPAKNIQPSPEKAGENPTVAPESPPEAKADEPQSTKAEDKTEDKPTAENPDSAENAEPTDQRLENWSAVVRELSKNYPLLAAYLNSSNAYLKGDLILIQCDNSQFNDLIKQATYREAVRSAAQTVLGKRYKLGPYKPKNAEMPSDPLDEVLDRLESFEQ